MKRQKNVGGAEQNKKAIKDGGEATRFTRMAMGKKKGKRAVEKVEKRKNVKDGGGLEESSSGGVVESLDELAWLRWGVVDEQMSWGFNWSPIWDVEYMGEACSEMFNDDVWDYDIWNLKSINQVPNPRD